ncbi:MAG: WYL domain-containing protein, partial [Calothrix sp. MO_167.B42]|nr:WYL domain-containing protein [Calothrix sp. MO_167.B42]
QLAKLGNYRIISTDEIRQQLYGDAKIQGNWNQIEEIVLTQIEKAIANGESVIYDATNAKRGWRIEILIKLSSRLPEIQWIAWYLKTPLSTCLTWNQKRDRQVPQDVIENMFQSLHTFPPIPAEGFVTVKTIDVTSPDFDIQSLPNQIQNLKRSIINRRNRTQHKDVIFHDYSHILDFERLMYLISSIIRYPGIGNLQTTNPSILQEIFGQVPQFVSDIDEISAIINKEAGQIYADKQAIASNLHWLQINGLIGCDTMTNEILQFKTKKSKELISPHSYSELEPFQRLIGTIRFILYHPFLPSSGEGSLRTLVSALKQDGVIIGHGLDKVRKDIELVLKPYQILPNFPLRHGYFAGTGILPKQDLIKVFNVLQSQAKSLDDPLALDIYEKFTQRMQQSRLIDSSEVYPVRGIAHRSIIDLDHLHHTNLARKISELENACANGELLELGRFPGRGKYDGDEEGLFQVWPLQIVFYNSAWYLGFECEGGKSPGLFRFERLDRLFLEKISLQKRSRTAQEKSLKKLQTLLAASVGIFLGYSASEQRLFFSKNQVEKSQIFVTVELWFNDDKFSFIAEGTKRFSMMKMSPPISRTRANLPKSIFSLTQTGDKQFPNRFQAILPRWCLGDFELVKWILGFGGSVKVLQPQELVEKIENIGQDIVAIYKGR